MLNIDLLFLQIKNNFSPLSMYVLSKYIGLHYTRSHFNKYII
jgi:hypothetical protein